MCRRSARQCIARLNRLRSTLHPPPGSGDFASMILRTEKLSRPKWGLLADAETVSPHEATLGGHHGE